ncbi:proline/glycine betaine ABC transporter substrate-binding protein ProX, partial [bacterium]|nr:proline/glycine betaine ABC transporter substrate-binding protein ProX [bacterium]
MKQLIVGIITLVVLSFPALGYQKLPGKDKSAQPARATWNTGYFQEALIRKALETLGYDVKRTKELQNSLFYKAVTLGDVDYWANGWFPNHYSQV